MALIHMNHVPITQRDVCQEILSKPAELELQCVCNSSAYAPNGKENISPALRAKPKDFLCILCKRSKRQKEKEAWFNSKAEGDTNTEPCDENPVQINTELSPNGKSETSDSLETILSAANKILISRLECPVCLQFMTPPLRQCRNGHSVCSSCHNRLNRCPTCRRSFIETSNVVLNELCLVMVVPCRNYASGCHKLLRLSEKVEHEKSCQWAQYDCPEQSNDCPWKGAQKDLAQHVLEKHSGTALQIQLDRHSLLRYTYGPVQPVEENGPETENSNIISRVLVLVDSDGEGRTVFVFSVKYDTTDESLCWVLRCVSSPQEASSYSYKTRLTSPDDSFKISTTTLAVSYSENVDGVLDGDLLKVSGSTFKKFVNENGKFFISIKVTLQCTDVEERHN